MTETPTTYTFTEPEDAVAEPLVCTIPVDGANAPRALSSELGLPVVLRDPIDRKRHFEAFGCDVRKRNPRTPDRVTPDVTFHRDVHTGADVTMHDGRTVRFWGFEDPTTREEPSQHLLRFKPSYFVLTGVPSHRTRTDRRVALACEVGERVVVRLLNAAYGPVEVRLPFDAEVLNMDGHTQGGPKVGRYSRPFTIPAGEPFVLSTAQRRDLFLVPDRAGVFPVAMEVKHWVQGTPQGTLETTITVT